MDIFDALSVVFIILCPFAWCGLLIYLFFTDN